MIHRQFATFDSQDSQADYLHKMRLDWNNTGSGIYSTELLPLSVIQGILKEIIQNPQIVDHTEMLQTLIVLKKLGKCIIRNTLRTVYYNELISLLKNSIIQVYTANLIKTQEKKEKTSYRNKEAGYTEVYILLLSTILEEFPIIKVPQQSSIHTCPNHSKMIKDIKNSLHSQGTFTHKNALLNILLEFGTLNDLTEGIKAYTATYYHLRVPSPILLKYSNVYANSTELCKNRIFEKGITRHASETLQYRPWKESLYFVGKMLRHSAWVKMDKDSINSLDVILFAVLTKELLPLPISQLVDNMCFNFILNLFYTSQSNLFYVLFKTGNSLMSLISQLAEDGHLKENLELTSKFINTISKTPKINNQFPNRESEIRREIVLGKLFTIILPKLSSHVTEKFNGLENTQIINYLNTLGLFNTLICSSVNMDSVCNGDNSMSISENIYEVYRHILEHINGNYLLFEVYTLQIMKIFSMTYNSTSIENLVVERILKNISNMRFGSERAPTIAWYILICRYISYMDGDSALRQFLTSDSTFILTKALNNLITKILTHRSSKTLTKTLQSTLYGFTTYLRSLPQDLIPNLEKDIKKLEELSGGERSIKNKKRQRNAEYQEEGYMFGESMVGRALEEMGFQYTPNVYLEDYYEIDFLVGDPLKPQFILEYNGTGHYGITGELNVRTRGKYAILQALGHPPILVLRWDIHHPDLDIQDQVKALKTEISLQLERLGI